MQIHIVMVDAGNEEGLRSHAQPILVFRHLAAAEGFAAHIQKRPERASFWIPPFSVEVVSMEVQETQTYPPA